MDDLKRKLIELLGYKFPEQQISPQWLEIEKILDQAFIRGFNSGFVTGRDDRLEDERFQDEQG